MMDISHTNRLGTLTHSFLIGVACVTLLSLPTACAKKNRHASPNASAHQHQDGYYTCPMHPSVVSDTFGSCPICKMDLEYHEGNPPGNEGEDADHGQHDHGTHESHDHAEDDDEEENGEALYTCPMHPSIVSDKPGSCPICKMDLVPKQGKKTSTMHHVDDEVQRVALSPSERVLANVKTVVVGDTSSSSVDANTDVNDAIWAVGVMAADQNGLTEVPSWLDGRIERLRVKEVGTRITRGQAVMDIYSPELFAAQHEFMLALGHAKTNQSPHADSLVAATRDRLLLAGMSRRQVDRIEEQGESSKTITLYAQNSGTITKILARQGQYVQTGTPLYELSDLSTLRVEAALRVRDWRDVHRGARARVVEPESGETRTGEVEFIAPEVHPDTRTVTVRVRLDDEEPWLPAGAFVTVYIDRDAPHDDALPAAEHPHATGTLPIQLPRSAVLRTGRHNWVFVEVSPNEFERREVRVARVRTATIEITEGVHAGERVAERGAFLLDSSVQLHAYGANAMHDHGPDAKEATP